MRVGGLTLVWLKESFLAFFSPVFYYNSLDCGNMYHETLLYFFYCGIVGCECFLTVGSDGNICGLESKILNLEVFSMYLKVKRKMLFGSWPIVKESS